MIRFALLALLASTIHAPASGWIREPRTNAPPPVVVPDPAPPAATVQTWRVEEIWRKDASRKLMVAHDVPRGTIFSHYDRNTRRNSRIEERTLNGRWSEIWNGGEETIGALPELAAVNWNGGHVFAAEVGANFLRYNHASGRMERLARIPEGYKWNIFPAPWRARDTVAVGGDGPNTESRVFDAFSGRELFKTPLHGLIAGMAEDSAGVMWCAISDGQRGVCTSDGRKWQDFPAASVAHPWGIPTAGSMEDGSLWQLRGGRWVKWIDLDASKVNKLVFDGRRGVLLAAASNPDTFVAIHIHQNGTVERIARFADQVKAKSGEQFDATIDVGRDGTVIFGRSTDKGTFAYRASPAGAAPVDPTPGPPVVTPDGPAYESLVWLAPSGREAKGGRPAPGTFKVWPGLFDGKKPGLFFEASGAPPGNWWASVTILRDGVYYTGPFDCLGDLNGRKFKSWANIYGGTKGGPYLGRFGPKGSESASRVYLMPRASETIWINAFDERSKAYYPLVPVTYPAKDR